MELPGHGQRLRERLFTAMPETVASLAHAIEPLLDRPFAIFGHSVGALIGYELTRHLERARARGPEHLFVSGCVAPHIPPQKRLHDLPEALLIDELLRMNGTPRVLLEDADLRRILMPVVRADLSIYETYVHRAGTPLACPITAISGREDPRAGPSQMQEWRRHTSSAFTFHTLPGDHFFLNAAGPQIAGIIGGGLANFADPEFMKRRQEPPPMREAAGGV